MTHYRALALGALIGFSMASVTSCSSTTCSPSQCPDGCCQEGRCVAPPDSTRDTSCGTGGAACEVCDATQQCGADRRCVARSTSVMDAGTCAGCWTTGGARVCIPLSSQGSSGAGSRFCGRDGVDCRLCPTGQVCNVASGTCVRPPSFVGAPCESDDQCVTDAGEQLQCRRMTRFGTASYPGGYCTKACAVPDAGPCPPNSLCLNAGAGTGEEPVCWLDCSTGLRCPAMNDPAAPYACYRTQDNRTWCWLNPFPEFSPLQETGRACADDAGLPLDGGCGVPERQDICRTADLGRRYPGGTCTRTFCLNDQSCGTNGICCEAAAAGNTVCPDWQSLTAISGCMQRCAVGGDERDGGATQSTCRPGFFCNQYIQPDGGFSADGFCYPGRAPNPTRIGQSCTDDLACSANATSTGFCFEPTLPDGGPSVFFDGYCSAPCNNDSYCGTNGVCDVNTAVNTGNNLCFGRCNTIGGRSNCRTGYTCVPMGLADGGNSTTFGGCFPSCELNGCPQGTVCDEVTGQCR